MHTENYLDSKALRLISKVSPSSCRLLPPTASDWENVAGKASEENFWSCCVGADWVGAMPDEYTPQL